MAVYNYALIFTQVVAHYTSAGVPPVIVQQPSAVTTNEGATAVMTVLATGTTPLSYQWYDNTGSPIPTGTSATLVLPSVLQSQAGDHYVTVANLYTPSPVYRYERYLLTVNAGPPYLDVDLQPPFYIGYANRQFTYTVVSTGPRRSLMSGPGTGRPSPARRVPFIPSPPWWAPTCCGHNSESAGPDRNPFKYRHQRGRGCPTLNPGDYTYKMKISFAGYNRSETLVDFPALVQFGTNLSGFAYGQLASPLAVISDSPMPAAPIKSPTRLTNGTPPVRLRSGSSALLSSTNDYIWAYWGNPAVTTPLAWCTNGTVWLPLGSSTPYDVVYHLKEGALPFQDSTQQSPATNGVAPAATPGVVGTGGAFNGSSWPMPAPTTSAMSLPFPPGSTSPLARATNRRSGPTSRRLRQRWFCLGSEHL